MKLVLLVAVAGLALGTQQGSVPRGTLPPPAIAMPADRADDSYEIYAQLLPGGNIEWGDAKRSVWLLEDTTATTVPDDEPCLPPGGGGRFANSTNPHVAIQPPMLRQAAFQAVLTDFDLHCHQRIRLSAERLHTAIPVRLLDDAARKRYAAERLSRPEAEGAKEFAGSAGMHSFSAVYFNPEHTLAMVYTGMWCGGLCGNWMWVPLEKTTDGKWHKLPWNTVMTVS